MAKYRNAHGGNLRASDIGNEVHLAGWIARRRDHGGVVFLDLRDASGHVQVVLNPDDAPASEEVMRRLRNEFCIMVKGVVRPRLEGTVNPDMPTGEVEVGGTSLEVLSTADTLPFQVDERFDADEGRRLQYRYLDLRRDRMADNLRSRSTAIRAMRHVLDDLDFLEVETPTLVVSTPEGARDMLVPSRLRPGQFYALPQSPQLFKQLLMVAGVERYYQVARCYRDEDFRSDRQVEFTQLDLEGSFWDQDDVLDTLQAIVTRVVKDVRGIDIPHPIPRMTYADAIARYGTDKPDVRFGMEIVDLGEVFASSEFRAFAATLADGGTVRGINAGDQGLSRAGFDKLVAQAQDLGAKGLVWMVVEEDGSLRSPVAKFLSEAELSGIAATMDGKPGDALLIVADEVAKAAAVLGELRLSLGRPDNHDDLEFLFVVDFPVFERTAEGGFVAAHHPFTAPLDVAEMRNSPETAVSRSYDMVLNGAELGSGSVRIHDPELQSQVFEILGVSADEAQARFGWFLEALRYGTPPHAGFAIGVDRFVSILQNEQNIREVMPFPKTQTGADPLTGAPGVVADTQLEELGIDVRAEVRAAWSDTTSDS
ncbi:MAG: aspartate--tRNA ligase [bacterium]|nr:aspartate--tRNA ligase [bacterium]MCP4967896.1 aspartate--tRNA ligase [bacterium]